MNEYLLEGTCLSQWLVAQFLEAPAMRAGDLDSSPDRADQLFRPRVLAHPCNPATCRSRSVTGRMSCLVRHLE